MPKRAPTPPPADDTRFFTVINPYPEQPYLALEDSKTFARWIACIIGEEHLLAFHHKPKSPNVVIIETSKTGPDFHKLMGAHRWGAFLRKPESAEKAGWICRDVASSWFKRWSPESDSSSFVCPYPQPRHCQPPSEDITGYPLCRPIPKRDATAKPKQLPNSTRAQSPSAASSDDAPTPSSSEFSDYPSTPPPGLTAPRFVPAIHGADVPKASAIIVSLSALSRPQRPQLSDADEDGDDGREEEEEAEKDLCPAHGVLCVSGICKERAARKREAMFAERARQREEGRGRRGRGGRQKHEGGRDAPSGDGQTVSDVKRPMEMPAHLRSWSAVAKGASPKGFGKSPRTTEDPKSRLRDDIRIEMASRKRNGTAKPSVQPTVRAMPPHLRKGASKDSAPSGSSRSSVFTSRSTSSHASVSASTASSSASPSVYTTSDDGHSVVSSESETSPLPRLQEKLDSQRGPWGAGINWRAYAGIREGDAESVATGATGDAFKNPWKHVQSKQSATPPRWASAIEEAFHSAGARAAWDEGDSDEDAEPF
ncbi:hypothetical protein ACG7TL_008549 [Trametes sanguinea]